MNLFVVRLRFSLLYNFSVCFGNSVQNKLWLAHLLTR
jgi:hypothetical protein